MRWIWSLHCIWWVRDQVLGWLWCRLLLLLLRLVIAFTAACFKLISSNQSWNISSLHMHTCYPIAQWTLDTPNEFYKIYYLNCNCYHYRFKPIQVQRKLHKQLKGQGKDFKKSMKKKKTLGKRENKLAIHYFQQTPSSLKLVYLKLICSYFFLSF